MITYDQLANLSQKHGSSFYLFYPDRFLRNLQELHRKLVSDYPNSLIAYAMKANYMPHLCYMLQQHGFWGEVVSGMEYNIARLYLPGNRLIFNGPCKSEREIKKALDEGSIVNLDSFYEIGILESLTAQYKEVPIGLRVNFNIGTGLSRFGFNFENGEFSRAVEKLGKLGNVILTSIHSHFTTKERSLELFKRRARGMISVYESLPQSESIQYINIGGGLFGPMSNTTRNFSSITPPTFEEYAKAITNQFVKKFGASGPNLVLEPGVSMVADAMDYVVQILDDRQRIGSRYLTVDGSVNCLFPTGSNYTPDYSIIHADEPESKICNISGYTCMEHDVLMSNVEIAAEPGDFIVFHNRGAYSNVYKPPFIKEAPAIIGVDGEVYARRQTFIDIIAPYKR